MTLTALSDALGKSASSISSKIYCRGSFTDAEKASICEALQMDLAKDGDYLFDQTIEEVSA